ALTAEECEARWADLAGGDARKAYQAIRELAANPGRSVSLLGDRVQPVKPLDPQMLARMIVQLDSERFSEREEATQKLAKLEELAEPALRQALKADPSLEVTRRIERLLARLKPS